MRAEHLEVSGPMRGGETGLLVRTAHSVCGLLVCGSDKYPDHRTCLLQADFNTSGGRDELVELKGENWWDHGLAISCSLMP